jgi:hypothetical protein
MSSLFICKSCNTEIQIIRYSEPAPYGHNQKAVIHGTAYLASDGEVYYICPPCYTSQGFNKQSYGKFLDEVFAEDAIKGSQKNQ